MNIKLTFSNLCARAAMLLMATVMSIGAWAEDDLADAVIEGIDSLYIYKGEAINISCTVKLNGINLTYGEDYKASFDKDGATFHSVEEETFIIIITKPETYTLTITTNSYDYEGEKQIKFEVGSFDSGNGSEGNPFIISNTTGLDLLSRAVYYGIEFNEEYFKVSADITYTYNSETKHNYNPIGGFSNNVIREFLGNFDGDGHTIKGIRVSISGEEGFVGLFGRLGKGAVVKNLTLDDADITGPENTGGIAGINYGGKITNCHVTNNVFINTDDNVFNDFHGGIAGQNGGNDVNGEISYCTSAAQLTIKSGTNWKYYGGIVGLNKFGSTLEHNLVIGATIPTSGGTRYGAIAGSINNDSGTTPTNGYDNTKYENIKNNYYADCSLLEDSKVGIGLIPDKSSSYDITGNDGAVPAIALYDSGTKADNNVTTISNNTGEHNIVLAGRTFYKDGDWNTLCLPFPMTAEQISSSPLSSATIKELDTENEYTGHQTGFDASNGTLYLYFKDATADNDNNIIKAGTPYIIKWAEGGDNQVDPVFSSVTILNSYTSTEAVANALNNGSITSTDGYVKFIGTYNSTNIYTAEKTNLYLGADNTLYYPSAAKNINAFRAYFQLLNGLTAGDPESGLHVRAFSLNFDDDPTGIITTDYMDDMDKDGAWYGLDGRKYSAKPTAKGLYINKGKKVVIK